MDSAHRLPSSGGGSHSIPQSEARRYAQRSTTSQKGSAPEHSLQLQDHTSQWMAITTSKMLFTPWLAILLTINAVITPYQGQLESGLPSTNETGSICTQLPNGDFVTLVRADAAIDAICWHNAPKNGFEGFNLKMAACNTTNSINIGVLYSQGSWNVTIFGGQFVLQGSNDTVMHSLAFLNGSNGDSTLGPFSDSNNDEVVYALAVEEDTLYIGGKLSRTVQNQAVNGLLLYDLYINDFTPVQPFALRGNDVTVAVVEWRPSTGTGNIEVYVGGNFDGAGDLSCPSICIYEIDKSAWKRPGSWLTGIRSFMTWIGGDTLITAGNFTVSKTPSPLMA
ncbi:uncharacterized protein PAC_12044 [Phialocephala subalpina]|uniref:Rax2-like C-terminal domain-containing protein n=1 Tax=Phialocephala subalpina TaxID=576137 RepID=A0A1L7XAZ5_9HELO|nr:uncharacterized protein PAC_12044 [Phialocephala subalpina]